MLPAGAPLSPVAAAALHLIYGTIIPSQPLGSPGSARVVPWGGASAIVSIGLLGWDARRPDVPPSGSLRAGMLVGGAS